MVQFINIGIWHRNQIINRYGSIELESLSRRRIVTKSQYNSDENMLLCTCRDHRKAIGVIKLNMTGIGNGCTFSTQGPNPLKPEILIYSFNP